MKLYQYYEQDVADPITVTDQQILYDFWDYWESKMVQKFGEGDKRITHDHCIDDWIVVNWAWEKK